MTAFVTSTLLPADDKNLGASFPSPAVAMDGSPKFCRCWLVLNATDFSCLH